MPEEVASSVGTQDHGVGSSGTGSPAQEPSAERFGESIASERALARRERPESGEQAATSPSEEAEKPKGKSRYARAREWRQALEKREAELVQREQAWQQREAQAKKPAYTLEELQYWRNEWAQDADWDPKKAELVAKADAEITKMQRQAQEEQARQVQTMQVPMPGTEAHLAQWRQAEAMLKARDSEFLNPDSDLDKKIRQILDGPDGEAYRRYPLGIIAVYDLAKRELLEEELKGLRTKFSKVEGENKRLNGLTSISGGVAGQFNGEGGGNGDFHKLTTKQMKERLLADARRGSGRLSAL
jgi:hypothetical protein